MKITSGRCVPRYSSACSADSAMSTSRLCCSSMRERTTRADLESSTMSARLGNIAGFRREDMWAESVAYFRLAVAPGAEYLVGAQRQHRSALAGRRTRAKSALARTGIAYHLAAFELLSTTTRTHDR